MITQKINEEGLTVIEAGEGKDLFNNVTGVHVGKSTTLGKLPNGEDDFVSNYEEVDEIVVPQREKKPLVEKK